MRCVLVLLLRTDSVDLCVCVTHISCVTNITCVTDTTCVIALCHTIHVVSGRQYLLFLLHLRHTWAVCLHCLVCGQQQHR